jgi:hypothetical protein
MHKTPLIECARSWQQTRMLTNQMPDESGKGYLYPESMFEESVTQQPTARSAGTPRR